MAKYLFSLIFAFTMTFAYSQIDSLENQILNYTNSKSTIISKGRNLLLDKFLENDLQKVKEIAQYLIDKGEDENYIALYPAEYWFILYWVNEYDQLANSLKSFDSIKLASYDVKIHPLSDMLFEKLKDHSIKYKDTLIKQLKASGQDSETEAFLLINFDYLLADVSNDKLAQDKFNLDSDHFLEEFPGSSYKKFIETFIRFKLIPSDWGMSYEFFSGYGLFTGVLSENYTNNIAIGVALDICYKKFEFYIRDYIGINKTKKDFNYSTGVWQEGSNTNTYLPEISVGYATIDKDRFKISPFAGIGSMDISPTLNDIEETPDLEELSMAFTATFLLGINIDFKFGKKNPSFHPNANYGFVRIRYAYSMPGFEKYYPGISGNMHYLTIGFGGLSRGLRREY